MRLVRHAVATALQAAAVERNARLNISERFRNTLSTTALCTLAVSIGLSGAAYAQQADTAPAATSQTLDEITVTGSRIRRTTDFDTANPTTVIDDSYLKNLGLVNVGDAITRLPANISTQTPQTTGNANFFAGSTIANLRGLNPFFGSRTLNLVNSRRFVPTNQGDGVDLNFIPSILIDRIDIVTGGASAAYGSGAIAGVNNIFLNRRLEGGKADIDFGQTAESDGKDRHVGLAYGFGLAEDRAHFVFGYEYQKTDPVGCLRARDWCARGVGLYQNNGSNTDLLLGENIRANQMSTSGVFMTFDPTASTTVQSNAAGTGLVPFQLGQQPFATNGGVLTALNVVPGGDGRSIYEYTNLRAPVKRSIGTGTFTFALNETTNFNIDLSYGDVETIDKNGALDAQIGFISGDNAFIQGNGLAAAVPGFAFINKDWTQQVDAHSEFTTKVKRAVVGMDGKFGASSWGWDGYYQYGLTDRRQLVVDNRHLNAYNYAADSVLVNGVPTCRVSTPGGTAGFTPDQLAIAAGCVPINPFGTQPLSAAAKAYAFGNLDEQLRYEQQVVALNASGDLLKGFAAGTIQGAVGVEYRLEKGENIAAAPPGTPDAVRQDFLIQYGDSFSGDVDITEGYVETHVPLLEGVTGARRLELDLAARFSHYKNKGLEGTTGQTDTHDLTTWKVSAIWDPVDWLRVRGSRSRDARAANFREQYYAQKISAGGIFAFCEPQGQAVRDPCDWFLRGNTDLDPEKADTTTVGLVFTPREWLEGFQFAADYYRISIEDAIQQAAVQAVLNGCNYGVAPSDPALCSQIVTATPNDFTDIVGLSAFATNGSGYVFKGIDFTGSYLMSLASGDSVNFRLLATHMIDQKLQELPNGPFVNIVGQTGTGNSFLSDNQPTADWVANLTTTWTHDALSVTGSVRYVSSGIMDFNAVPGTPTPGTNQRNLSTNRVPSYSLFTLTGAYDFQDLGVLKSLQVFAVVDNLFDKEPPIAVGGGPFGPSNGFGGTNPVFFDTLGRTYKLGIRTTF
jgi:iron complex outermembrane receptor protein